MEKLVSAIQGLSGEDEELLQQLQKALIKESEFLSKNRQSFDHVLELLDYHKHSLGVLHLLASTCTTPKYNRNDFIKKVTNFLTQCSEIQIKQDPKKFALICHKLVENCTDIGQTIRAVKPLQIAISKIAPQYVFTEVSYPKTELTFGNSSEHLSPQHADFVLACILSKTYKTALPILDRFDYQIDPARTGVKAEDVRLFFYYGGICYIAQRKFAQALQYLENVISAPALVTSVIMVESYKKYILASLIHCGEVKPLPRYTNQLVMRLCKQMCSNYEELANTFSVRSVEELERVMKNNRDVFYNDGNLGLVGQVLSALKHQNVQRLTKTYVTVTLPFLVSLKAGESLSEAQTMILKMIETGELRATINENGQVVTFEDDEETYNTNEMIDYLGKQIQFTMSLSQKMSRGEREIELSDKYIHQVFFFFDSSWNEFVKLGWEECTRLFS
eukprot:TRINITY_DN5781_c0_g1_i3.p1 TRINITY_DN5781_c0_g1~~TRINITY_DN5781_c0_g1_i3.p1  ORF type:complete len:447 (-),score=59.47 TRINITY_DN5781_c0_g1_i3:264-1604(-)